MEIWLPTTKNSSRLSYDLMQLNTISICIKLRWVIQASGLELFFHALVKWNNQRNKITSVAKLDGSLTTFEKEVQSLHYALSGPTRHHNRPDNTPSAKSTVWPASQLRTASPARLLANHWWNQDGIVWYWWSKSARIGWVLQTRMDRTQWVQILLLLSWNSLIVKDYFVNRIIHW